ncbi:MAG: cob(I)yrinic acid a,c-diamide adenosyltransferase [Thermoguttaceae bacterium]|nr:cob(I)yrinic acid a,c-diamide adenosyltransferase [Thermoguttaceae bacterium]
MQKRVRLYSRRGDLGETSLLFGPRVGKDHRRVELLGELDELNAQIGVILAERDALDPGVAAALDDAQYRLFDVGTEVATLQPAKYDVKIATDADVAAMETLIDEWDAKVEPARGFIVPGGAKSASALQLARAICRRAERRATALLRFDSEFSPRVIAWLNRLGDLLYVFARFENQRRGVAEKIWSPKRLDAE